MRGRPLEMTDHPRPPGLSKRRAVLASDGSCGQSGGSWSAARQTVMRRTPGEALRAKLARAHLSGASAASHAAAPAARRSGGQARVLRLGAVGTQLSTRGLATGEASAIRGR